jgi:hypothetical protein
VRCPHCRATGSDVKRTHTLTRTIERERSCSCGARWRTEEKAVRGTLKPPVSATEGAPVAPPVAQTAATDGAACLSDSLPPLFSLSSPEFGPSKLTLSNSNTMSKSRGRDKVVVAPAGQPNAFTKALGQFCEIWRTRYGESYSPTPADRSQLGRLLSTLTAGALEALPKAFWRYLDDHDPYVAQSHGHSLCFFCSSGGFNKYRVEPLIMSSKEARGHAAGEQWLRMHEEMDNARK